MAKHVPHGPRRQRGAAAVFAAISMIAGLAALALGIDLGRLYFAQRDLQRVTNLAALDSARMSGGCYWLDTDTLLEAQRSAERNGGETGKQWIKAVTLGYMDASGGLRNFVSGVAPSGKRAVQIRAEREPPARILPLFGATSASPLIAYAAAHSSPRAVVHVGSKLVEINDGPLNAVYGGLFGVPLNLGVATYQGLVNSNLLIQDLLDEVEDALGSDDPLNDPVPVDTLLDIIGGLIGSAELNGLGAAGDVVLSEVLGTEEPLPDAQINASQLLTLVGLEQAEDAGDFAIDLPLDLFGLAGAEVQLISPGFPTPLAPVPEEIAENTQVRLSAQLPSLDLNLGLVQTNPLELVVEAAKARANVEAIHCARSSDDEDIRTDRVDVHAEADAASIKIPQVDAATITIGGILKITLRVSADIVLGSADSAADPPEKWQDLRPGDLRNLTTNDLDLEAGITVTPVLQCLVLQLLCNALPPVNVGALTAEVLDSVVAVLNPVLVPVLGGLGVNVAGADVTVIGIDAPQPYLFSLEPPAVN